jgi:acetyl esterase/lipase
MVTRRTWGVVWLVLLASALGGPAQEKPKPPATPRLPEGVKVLRNLDYIPGVHERNKLDLYLPEKANGPLPVIVWIHGGAWQAGSKENPHGLAMVPRGYALASINYRLSQHAVFPAQIQDCKAAIRWLRANAPKYHLDGEHIGVWGASAGGHLVALLGTTGGVKELEGAGGNLDQSSRVQAVVDWFGPTDFTHLGPTLNEANSVVSRLLGGPASENKAKAAQASPVRHVSKDAAPFLIMHGDKDNLVPISQSEELAEALKKAGVEVTFQTLPGAGHGGSAFTNPENRKLIGDFFNKHLRGKK